MNKIYILIEKIFKLVLISLKSIKKYRINDEKLLKLMYNYNPASIDGIDDIRQRKIKIFNRVIKISDLDMAWHMDPFSSYKYKKHYIYFGRPKTTQNDDIKSIWELSRLNFILPIVLEIQHSKNVQDIHFIKDVIFSFIRNNKYFLGVHWINPMEVSIRSLNICLAYSVIHKSLSTEEKYEIEKYLIKSLFFVYEFKENKKISNNHYLSNLLYISVASDLFNIEDLISFSKSELENELKTQVYKDGTVFESSTYYHRLSLEMVFYAILFKIKMNAQKINPITYHEAKKYYSRSTLTKLYKMFLFIKYSIKNNGQLPIIGDNDSGQVLKTYDDEVLDVSYLLSLGSCFFKKDLFLINKFFNHPLTNLITECTNGIYKNKNFKTSFVKRFNNSGWVVFRYSDIFLFISSGKNGQSGKGGHAHNDKTSYVLSRGQDDIILAGGTYCYTCNESIRKSNRSNLNHNVASLIDKDNNLIEQNNLNMGNFVLEENCFSKIDKVLSDNNKTIIVCSHAGYKKYTDKRHIRKFTFDKKLRKLTINDSEYIGFEVLNNVLVNDISLGNVLINADYKIEPYKYSEIYYSYKKCTRIQFKVTTYEIQL